MWLLGPNQQPSADEQQWETYGPWEKKYHGQACSIWYGEEIAQLKHLHLVKQVVYCLGGADRLNADMAGRFIDQTLHRLVAIGIRCYANEYEVVPSVAWLASLGNFWEGMHPVIFS